MLFRVYVLAFISPFCPNPNWRTVPVLLCLCVLCGALYVFLPFAFLLFAFLLCFFFF